MNRSFELNIKKIQLDNGLKILALEDHFIPIISYYTFYKVGSRNEIPGITGISHLFEHMMFKGSKKFNNVSFDKILEPVGGYSNAYTSKDMTVFYENFPPDVLSLVVELDSDRMSNLNLDIKELNSEREVVKEERRYRTDNSIIGKLDEELYLAGYNIHPYRFPIIGFMSDLDNISVDDCYDYLKTYYNPGNSCIVVVGDFNFDVLLKLIEEHYGGIESPLLKKQFITSEPIQSSEKRIEYYKPAEVYSFMIGFHVPDVFSPDVYTLEILQTVLTDGESSLLQKKLVYEEQIALSIFSDFTWRIDPSYFVLYVQMKPNYTAEEGEKILHQVIEKVKNGDISDKEIVKAKNKIESNFIKSIKTTSGKGEKIGTFETLFSDYKLIFNILDEINKIEKDNLIKVANKYFTKNNRTIVTLFPK